MSEKVAAGCVAIVLMLGINGLMLAGGVWIVVKVLQWTGVL